MDRTYCLLPFQNTFKPFFMHTPESIDTGNLILFLQCLNVFLAIIIVFVLIALIRVLSKLKLTVDDPTGEVKQKIFDTLSKVKDGIEATV